MYNYRSGGLNRIINVLLSFIKADLVDETLNIDLL